MTTAALPDGILKAFEQKKEWVYEKLESHLELLEEDGKYMEAIRMRENGVFAGREHFGKEHPVLQEAVQALVLKCNSFAMKCLTEDQLKHDANEFLTMADQHTSSAGYLTDTHTRLNLRSVTMNNFGCFYKSVGKLHTAVQYMEKALKIEASTPACENPAGTHLNVCAILSELGRHRAAADHAKCAIQLLKYQKTLQQKKDAEERMDETATEDGPLSNEGGGDSKAPTSVLAVAYFNWGAELEHMKRYDAATSAYTLARKVAYEELEETNSFFKTVEAALQQARSRAARSKTTPRRKTPRPTPETEHRAAIASPRRSKSPRSLRGAIY